MLKVIYFVCNYILTFDPPLLMLDYNKTYCTIFYSVFIIFMCVCVYVCMVIHIDIV